ncbi:hypothetical protein [Agrococcus sp. ProA11]|uniref:hypothetical protein n=1 Tax=Agrococcus chionoecetis TaxID=3153752 RepID=UPI0032612248
MDEQPERGPSGSAEAEARRRVATLAELHRRRRHRRWTVGIAAAAASAVIIAGSVVAWSAQARAGDIADRIEAWHLEHELAGCELADRIVRTVALERRAQDVLTAAQHVAGAEWVLPSSDRSAFEQDRQSILTSIEADGFVSEDDRELADAWQSRAAASDDPSRFDLVEECVTAAAAQREPITGVTAERADALAQQLRALGDPRDFDDARIDRFEAAIASLERSAVALAQRRTELPALQSSLPLAPEHAKASLRDADRHLTALLAIVAGEPSPSAVLDLVEGITLHVAAVWMTEAWQLEAEGDVEASAALAAQSQQAREAVATGSSRPVALPKSPTPAPAAPPSGSALDPQPSPTAVAPAPPTASPGAPPEETAGSTPTPTPPPEPEPEPSMEPAPSGEPEPLPPLPDPPTAPTP